MRVLVVSLLVLVAFTSQARAQCGPDKDKPYPPGTTTCPSGPAPATGGASGTLCSQDSPVGSYTEDISDGVTRKISTATGCPNHPALCTGKAGVPNCGAIGAAGTATEASERTNSFTVPLYPKLRAGAADTSVKCAMGAQALARNGIALYGPAVNTDCDLVDPADDTSEWTSFDYCSGHAQQQARG